MGERLLNWGLPGICGAAGYGVYTAAGMPTWTVFPMMFLGAIAGSAGIAVWRGRTRMRRAAPGEEGRTE